MHPKGNDIYKVSVKKTDVSLRIDNDVLAALKATGKGYQSRINNILRIDIYTYCVYNYIMIKSFADKETELIYNQKFSKRLPTTIQKVALRKLMMIDNAKCLEDLRVPPSNHPEQLVGNRKGQPSIRIDDQWRVCFTEKDGHYYNVEIVDYH